MRQFDDNIPSRAFDNFQVNCVVILWNYGAAYLDQTWEILTMLVQCSLWTSHRSCQDLYPQAKRRQNLLFQHWWRSQNSSRQQWVFSFLGIFLVKTTPNSGTFGSSVFFSCSTHPNWFISGFLGSKRRGFPNRPVLPPPVSDRQQYSGCSAVKHAQSTSYGAAPKTPPAPQTPSAPRQDSDIGDPQVLSSDLGTMKHQCGYVMFGTFTSCWTPVLADLSNLLEPSQGPCFWVRPSGTITAWEHSLKFPWRHWSWHQLYTWMSW